ncbi:MAG: pyruvate dehydrogenase, partial [Lentisphaerae bacterium]|nr:pyruvate dehydrogenase [Lentisphaerota bacterium]
MGNYYSDLGPDFKKKTIKIKPIEGYTYGKMIKDELKDGTITKNEILEMYEAMLVIREFEEMILKLRTGAYECIKEYEYRGPTHLSIGQEATAAGACTALNLTDYITSTH